MIGNNHNFPRIWSSKWPTYAFEWCSPCCYHKHHNPKQIVRNLTFELERRLKLRVYKVGPFLRHLYGYNSVCLLQPVNPLRLPERFNLVTISSCFGNTHHLTEAFMRSASSQRIEERICYALYLSKIKDKQENQVAHTYKLIEAKIFMEATKWDKEKIDIIRW